MTKTRKIAIATVVALGLAGAGAAVLPSLSEAHGWDGARSSWGAEHVEGRIAFLKAELKITDAQAAQWDALATVMRSNAAARSKLVEETRASGDKPMTAIERIALRQRFAETRAKSITAFAEAFQPLYDRMNDDQRKAADALFQPHRRHG